MLQRKRGFFVSVIFNEVEVEAQRRPLDFLHTSHQTSMLWSDTHILNQERAFPKHMNVNKTSEE